MKKEKPIYEKWQFWTLAFVVCFMWLFVFFSIVFHLSVAIGFIFFLVSGYILYSKFVVDMLYFYYDEEQWWMHNNKAEAVIAYPRMKQWEKANNVSRYGTRPVWEFVGEAFDPEKKEPWE